MTESIKQSAINKIVINVPEDNRTYPHQQCQDEQINVAFRNLHKHLVDEIMSKQDAVKGQAFVTMAMTFSSLIASVFGGLIINIFGVTATLWIGTFITLVGVVISIYALFRINTQKV